MIRTSIFCILILMPFFAQAKFYNKEDFSNNSYYPRYKQLISELRCLVCQNQNLASSDAELANNLRDIIVEHLEDRKSNESILNFMVERYGNFVLYNPPLQKNTLLLWSGPLIILILSGLIAVFFIRKQLIKVNKK